MVFSGHPEVIGWRQASFLMELNDILLPIMHHFKHERPLDLLLLDQVDRSTVNYIPDAQVVLAKDSLDELSEGLILRSVEDLLEFFAVDGNVWQNLHFEFQDVPPTLKDAEVVSVHEKSEGDYSTWRVALKSS